MKDYLELSRKIGEEVLQKLIQYLSDTGYQGIVSENPRESKSTHRVDIIAAETIKKVLENVACQLFMESFEEKGMANPQFSIFIDPVDGSINWDRGIGDPAICIAITQKIKDIYFRDLDFVYIQGFRSGDVYYFHKAKAWYENKLTGQKWPVKKLQDVALNNAMGYLKTGYGGAQKQLEKTLPLFYACKDIRAIDNSAMEMAELSRAATDFIVDARDLSDNYNLLAYPLVNHAGGVITDLSGEDIGNYKIVPDKIINFIAAGSRSLHRELMAVLA